jgi:hypothetical protein
VLEKIEAAYLAAMRVIVLVAATLALIVAVIGVVNAAPMIAKQLGLGESHEVAGADLTTFVDEQRAAGTPVETDAEGAPPLTQTIPGKIAKATNLVAHYLRERSHVEVDVPGLERVITEKRNDLDAGYRDAYDDSLLTLATDLNGSRGKALSGPRVAQMLDWHLQKFKSDIEYRKIREDAVKAKAMLGLAIAGGAILAFLIILFFFLFVKIERNLRIVRTREVEA